MPDWPLSRFVHHLPTNRPDRRRTRRARAVDRDRITAPAVEVDTAD